jgi:hypothetical protein
VSPGAHLIMVFLVRSDLNFCYGREWFVKLWRAYGEHREDPWMYRSLLLMASRRIGAPLSRAAQRCSAAGHESFAVVPNGMSN